MRLLKWLTLLVPILVGLIASISLFVDYVRPVPVFCEEGGGCEAVKRTVFASVLGIPTPAFGVLGFLVLATLAMLRGKRARIALVVAAAFGACAAAFLLMVQRKMGVYCIYCVATDLSALLVLGEALYRYKNEWDPPDSPFARAGAGSALAILALGTGAFGMTKKPKLPDVVAQEIARTPPGKVTVVDFADFECPWCRLTHSEISSVLEAHAGDVRVVRKMVPLRMHPHAMDAAKAACCGEEQGKGDAIAEELFTSDVANLTPDGCAHMAAEAGVDLDRYRACVADPKTAARIHDDSDAFFNHAHGHGLPTLFVDDERLDGAQDRASFEDALARALARHRS